MAPAMVRAMTIEDVAGLIAESLLQEEDRKDGG